MKKVVLAYSGGLDTSCAIKWLQDKGYEVIAFMADVGQNEDFDKIKKRALKTGASKVHIINMQKEFVTDYIHPAIKAGAIYENKYLLATALSLQNIKFALLTKKKQQQLLTDAQEKGMIKFVLKLQRNCSTHH